MAKRSVGRPTTFTQKIVEKICERLANGESLRQICKDDAMPVTSTVHLWLLDEKHKVFSEQYDKARRLQADYLFDETLEIADDGSNDWMEREYAEGRSVTVPDQDHISRSRLRVDTRKWYISKVLPKKYGDKMDVTSDGKAIKGNTIVLADFRDETNG